MKFKFVVNLFIIVLTVLSLMLMVAFITKSDFNVYSIILYLSLGILISFMYFLSKYKFNENIVFKPYLLIIFWPLLIIYVLIMIKKDFIKCYNKGELVNVNDKCNDRRL